jgi:S1-C subfamily serine protease
MKSSIQAIILFLCLVFTLAPSTSQARGPYGSITVGNWKGGAFTDDKNGAFSSCAASASYQNGVVFLVSIAQDYSWSLGFAHESWKLTPGDGFPLALTFDGQAAINVRGLPIGTNLVKVSMPSNSSLIAQFRKAKTMTAFAQGQLLQFNMTQTAQLLPSLVNCVVSVKKNGLAKAGEFAVAMPKPAAAEGAGQPGKTPKTFTQSGTGFVISTSGHIVTNAHVVNDCTGDIQGNLTGEAPVKLRLVSSDRTNDLAVLQAPSPFKDLVTIRDKPVHSGDSVVAIGFPFHGMLTSDFTVTTGIVSSLGGLRNDTRFLQISAAVQPGNSGGPLLDSEGQLVGIVSGKLDTLRIARATGDVPENINFAIKTGMLRDFLDNSAIAYQTTTESKGELKTSDIAQNARKYTLLISCTATERTASAKKSEE